MKYDAVVIGAGPGGYVCAIRCGQLGLKTAIIEKENVGGVCLNVGCIPSKALIHAATTFYKIKNEASHMGISVTAPSVDLHTLQAWKNGVVKKLTGGVAGLLKTNNVELIKGTAKFIDKGTLSVTSLDGEKRVVSNNFVIATGSSNIALPTLPINGKNIISSTEALDLKELPNKMVVIGGGFIGLEIGIAYAKLGSEVTIIEATNQVLPNIDADLVDVVMRKMKKLGITVLTNTLAKGFKGEAGPETKVLNLITETGKSQNVIQTNCVLVSVGRKPNSENLGLENIGITKDNRGNIITDKRGRTNVVGIYAIGDVNGAPQLAHRASMDGILAAEDIKEEKGFRDYKTVPWAVFSDPEIAVCGLSEKEAKDQGISYRIGKYPFLASSRGLSTNETDGFIKVLLNEADESLIGVHIVGPEASNLIAEAALAIEMGACADDVIRTIHTHPTLPEAFPEAIEAAYLKAIHIANRPARKT